jgi:4-amino-4-deoxychorismate lyase
MYPLLETIYLLDGAFRNLPYHEARMSNSINAISHRDIAIDLKGYLNSIHVPASGLFKTRIIYETEIRKVEFVPYTIKPVQSLKLVHSDAIEYDHKFLDRSLLQDLFSQRGELDEILIVKNGFITDTSYSNVIFKKGKKWFTPKHYLLNGTMRKYLLDNGKISEAVIDVHNYLEYESVKLVNAMLGMEGEEISIKCILR